MSGTNAIHGIVVLGALLVLGNLPADAHWGVRIIAFVALVFGTLNVIGGFLVTDRMLGMFKGKKDGKRDKELSASEEGDAKAKELAK
jgi:NAD(P) transhydrogenase subunit alpha